MMRLRVFLLCLLVSATAFSAEIPQELKDVGIEEKLGASVDLESLKFKDEQGRDVTLKEFFKSRNKPVVLTLVYYECPNLCNFLLNGFVDALRPLDWVPGGQFDIVSVSIDPREGPELAESKKASYIKSLGKPDAAKGWHFLTGTEDQIKKLSQQVGFSYKFDKKEKQYAHSAALFVLTPEGKLSRILFGIQFSKRDLRLALLEASSGRIGTVVDRLLMFCYRYDASRRGYGLYAMRLVQASSASAVILLGGVLLAMWRKEKRSRGSKLDV